MISVIMVIMRNTKEKQILEHELDNLETFFTAEELYVLGRKFDKKLGIATVYRFLNEKKKSKLLYVYLCDRKSVYSKQNKSHCHFICEKTGKVTHFEIDSLDFLKDKIPGSITSYQIEVRGICKDNCSICKH